MATPIAHSNRGHGSRRGRKPIAEINVTPFVDVMLVLLVVFMVTAPLLTVGVQVDLPTADARQVDDRVDPWIITVDETGQVYLEEQPVELEALGSALQAISEIREDTRIFVRGDRDLAYGRVMQVMTTINQAGYSKVALIAELPAGDSGPTQE